MRITTHNLDYLRTSCDTRIRAWRKSRGVESASCEGFAQQSVEDELEHRQELFRHLQQRWTTLFDVGFDVLLYDLTSTYVEGAAELNPKAKRGYSRDGRPDCKQVVVALVVTPEGFPLAYEVMDGNTSDKTTLRGFLKKIEDLYGQARRVWLMDRGIPTEEVLAEMRTCGREAFYLVGTPRGRVAKYEKQWLDLAWR